MQVRRVDPDGLKELLYQSWHFAAGNFSMSCDGESLNHHVMQGPRNLEVKENIIVGPSEPTCRSSPQQHPDSCSQNWLQGPRNLEVKEV